MNDIQRTGIQADPSPEAAQEALAAELALAERRLREAHAALSRAREGGGSGPSGIPRRPGDRTRAPLSFAQEQLWFIDQLTPGRATYNIPVVLRLDGPLDVRALQAALSGAIERHEALRTTFAAEDGRPYQLINPAGPVHLPLEDLSELPAEDRRRAFDTALAAEIRRPFDLAHDPMLRPRLYRLGPHQHMLCMNLNHICADGWSVRVLLGDLAELYDAARTGRLPSLSELPIQYGDFASWQQDQLREGAIDHHLDYWARKLADVPVLDIPTDRPRPSTPSNRGGRFERWMPDVIDGLRGLCRRTGANLFATLAAGVGVVLARYSGVEDIVIGRPSAGRLRPELDNVVGFFANMVTLRIDLSGDPTFGEVVNRTMRTILEAWDHQAAPFEKVVSRLGLQRDASRNPVFQVGMDLESASGGAFQFPGLDTELLIVHPGAARFDIGFKMYEHPDALQVISEYASDLFDESRIERIFSHLEQVLLAGAADPDVPVHRMPMLREAERQRILHEWQGPEVPQSPEPVHVQVARMAQAHPELPAAEQDGESLSYGDLERRAGTLARHLRAMGVGHEDIVALALPPGIASIVAMLGVLKAGAAFAPLDVNHPPRRLAFILADTAARLVITAPELEDRLPEPLDWRPLRLDARGLVATEPPTAEGPADDEPWEELAGEGSLAYVLYTSGSTGEPKGVMVEHRGLSTFLLWSPGGFGLRPGARTLQHMALIFDFAIGEVFTALVTGATVVFVPEELRAVPQVFGRLLVDERITLLCATPSILAAVEPGAYPDLTNLVLGGEAVPGELVNRWNVNGRSVVNGYGPTEISIGCTSYRCEPRTWTSQPPIGRPMHRRTNYVLDRWGNLAPVGVPGELVVGGAGLARGYLNRPELTAERFVDDPFLPGGRMYRTGDVAAWTEDGQLRFAGRIDTQVKLNGVRIELEEIESVLLTHPGVAEAAVAVCEDERGTRQLAGYVVPSGEAPDPLALRAHLSESLPTYMVPRAFVVMDRLPLSPTGKVDRGALPAPGRPDVAEGGDAPPATEAEARVAMVFAEVLGVQRVGANDDFFALGGSSLQAARTVLRLSESLGAKISVRDFFTSARVADVARLLVAAGAGVGSEEEALVAEVAEAERRLREAREAFARTRGQEAGERLGAEALPPRAPRRASGILLTGATGFFGVFLLHELLAQTEARIHCLVRGADDEEAWRRLRGGLAKYGRDQDLSRVSVLRGDLGLASLGLGEEGFARLAGQVDMILHNGAEVGGLFPLERLEPQNVGSTREMVRLATTGTLKEVHYVSSLSAQQLDPDGEALDRAPGYVASKWQAERVLLEARSRGVPVSIFRLPRLSGDSRTGRSNEKDLVVQMLRRFIRFGIAAELDGNEVWTPVDEAAWSLVRTMLDHPDGGLYTMTTPSQVRLRHVIDLASEGGRLEVMPIPDWMREIAARSSEEQELVGAIFAATTPVPRSSSRATGPEFAPILARGVDDSLVRRYLDELFVAHQGVSVGTA